MKPSHLDKRRAILAVVVPAALLLGLTTRPWATGETRDALSREVVAVTGGSAAPGVVGLAIVCVLALLGAASGGRIIRAVSAGVLVLASLGALVLVGGVALRPADTVAAAVARDLARTTSPETTGASTPWAWATLVVATVFVVGAASAAISSRGWGGLSSRYERAPRPEAGPRGQLRSTWDELTEGGDPTASDGSETK